MDDEGKQALAKQRFQLFIADDPPTAEGLGVVMRSLGHNPSHAELCDLVENFTTVDAFSSMMVNRECLAEDEVQQLITRLRQDIAEVKAKASDGDWKQVSQIMALEGQIQWQDMQKMKERDQEMQKVLMEERQKRQQLEERLGAQTAEGKVKKGEDNKGDDVLAPRPPDVEDTLTAAWDKTYEVSPVLNYVLQTLDGYAEQWSNPAYESPWTCMIQSSGWGKSRTICQLSSHGVYIIYISFRDSALPRGTPGAKDYFKRVKGDVRKIAAAFVGCMDRLSEELDKRGDREDGFPGEWVSIQTSPKRSNFWQGHSWGMLEEAVSALSKRTHSDVTLDEWDDQALKDWVEFRMKVFNAKSSCKVREKGLKVLFCLDEAGSLFAEEEKLFMTMRRAFSCFPRWERIFAVLMDTSAQLQILAPSRLANPSLKGRLPETKIFAPLCLAGVPWFSCEDLKSGMCGIVDCDKATRMLFSVGRPLWRACLRDQPELPMKQVVSYAVQKLLGGRSLTDVSKLQSLSEDMAIGILGASVGIEVVAWSNLAQTLVASHMRTAVVVSEERDRLFSADTVEPILGEAAAQVLRTEGMLLKVLNALEVVCKQAYVLEGPRGELIGRLILLLTMQECRKMGGTYSHPVPLQKFLSKLCRKEVKCVEGRVFFNRCCALSGDLTQNVLLQCYLGCFAVIPRRNQEGFDFLIPVLYAAENGNYVLEKKYMGAIPCQFRDRNLYTVNAGDLIIWARHFKFSGSEKKRKRNSDDTDVLETSEVFADICDQSLEAPMQRTNDDADEELLDADEDPVMPDSEYMDFLQKKQEEASAALQRRREKTFQKRQEGTQKNKEIIEGLIGDEEAEGSKRNEDKGIELGKAVGLYFHLNSPKKSEKDWVVQIEDIVVFHGIRTFSYLDKEVINRFEVLRHLYHKLESMVKSDLELECLKHVVWTYFSFFNH